jgi:hypothetical protein
MISGQWGPAAATGSTVTAISDDVTQICAEVQASRCAHDKGSIHLQQSPQSPDNAADTYSPLISPSPNDDSVLLVSHSMSGQEKMPQQGSQNQILHIWNQCLIRSSSHLLRSKLDQGATSVSSAPSRHPPHIGIESNKLVPSLPEHASFSFAPRKWKRSSSTSPTFSGIPQRKKFVRFSFCAGDDCTGSEATPNAVEHRAQFHHQHHLQGELFRRHPGSLNNRGLQLDLLVRAEGDVTL